MFVSSTDNDDEEQVTPTIEEGRRNSLFNLFNLRKLFSKYKKNIEKSSGEVDCGIYSGLDSYKFSLEPNIDNQYNFLQYNKFESNICHVDWLQDIVKIDEDIERSLQRTISLFNKINSDYLTDTGNKSLNISQIRVLALKITSNILLECNELQKIIDSSKNKNKNNNNNNNNSILNTKISDIYDNFNSDDYKIVNSPPKESSINAKYFFDKVVCSFCEDFNCRETLDFIMDMRFARKDTEDFVKFIDKIRTETLCLLSTVNTNDCEDSFCSEVIKIYETCNELIELLFNFDGVFQEIYKEIQRDFRSMVRQQRKDALDKLTFPKIDSIVANIENKNHNDLSHTDKLGL